MRELELRVKVRRMVIAHSGIDAMKRGSRWRKGRSIGTS